MTHCSDVVRPTWYCRTMETPKDTQTADAVARWLELNGRARYNPTRRKAPPKTVPIVRSRFEAYVSGALTCPYCGTRLTSCRPPRGGVFYRCVHGGVDHPQFWTSWNERDGLGLETRLP